MNKKRNLAYGLIALLALCAGLAFTPPGQALARQLIQFFNTSDTATFPIPPEQQLPAGTEPQTSQSGEESPLDSLSAEQLSNLDSQTAAAITGWRAAAPVHLPEGYQLKAISYNPSNHTLESIYQVEDDGQKSITLLQGDEVPLPAVKEEQAIQIGGKTARLIHPEDGSNGLVLTWSADGRKIVLSGAVDEQALTSIADGIETCQNGDYTCQVTQAAAAAGFQPMQFASTPKGYEFNLAYYLPGQTAIWYSNEAGELGLMQSGENFTSRETSPWFSVPGEAIQQVTVGGQPAEYVNGAFQTLPGDDHATWMPDSGQIRLRWQQDGSYFEIVKWGEPVMQPQQLADLAATLRNDPGKSKSNHPVDEPQPANVEAVTSLETMKQNAVVPVLVPQIVPQNLPFSHGILSKDGATLFYGTFSEDYVESLSSMLMVLANKSTSYDLRKGFEAYPPEAFSETTVNAQPALIIRGTMLTNPDDQPTPKWMNEGLVTITWFTDDVQRGILYDPVGSGEQITDEELVQIAESMQ